MANIVKNGDFEASTIERNTNRWKPGWTQPDHPVLPNVVTAKHWTVWWRDGFPGPGSADQLTGQIESKVPALPEFPDPVRIHSGARAVMEFTFWRNKDAGWQQTVTTAVPGQRYRFSIYAHSYHSDCDSKPHDLPYNKTCDDILDDSHCWLSVGIDPNGGIDPFAPSVVWSKASEAYGAYPAQPLSVEAVANSSTVTVFTRAWTVWALKHGDTYWDDAVLEPIGVQQSPSSSVSASVSPSSSASASVSPSASPSASASPSESDECEGKARYQFVSTRALLPPDVTIEEWKRAIDIYAERLGFLTRSADEAMIYAGLDDITVYALSADRWPGGKLGLTIFKDTYYRRAKLIWDDITLAPANDILLWMLDPQWKDKHFGGTACYLTIGQSGCFITGLAMGQRWYKINPQATPVSVDSALGIAAYTACRVTSAALIESKLGMTIAGATETQLRAHLASGGIGMAEVAPETYEHFVLITAYDSAANDYHMYDPYKNVSGSFKAYYPAGADSWRTLTKVKQPSSSPSPSASASPSPSPQPPLFTEPPWHSFPSVHAQSMQGQVVMNWITAEKMAVGKCLASDRDVKGIYRAYPGGIMPVYRPMVPGPNVYDPVAGTAEYIARFSDSMSRTCDEMEAEFGKANLVAPYYLIEFGNEMISSSDPAFNQLVYNAEVEYCRQLVAKDHRVGPAVGCIAVGNPPENEYIKMVPVARAAANAKGALSYHCYWGANPTDTYLAPPHWQWLAGRYVYMDDVFVANGVRVKWYSGESGPCACQFYSSTEAMGFDPFELTMREEITWGGITKPRFHWVPLPSKIQISDKMAVASMGGGYMFNPLGGWKAADCLNGDWPRYRGQIVQNVELRRDTRIYREGRDLGWCIFTTGEKFTGWEPFWYNQPEMLDTTLTLQAIYGV